MNKELQQRIITSIFLLLLLISMFFFTYILIISTIIISIIAWIEFYGLIAKIFLLNNSKDNILRILFKSISLIYLSMLVYIIIISKTQNAEFELFIFYAVLVSIMTDTGGLFIGKSFKGKKLTSISPKKTISGSIGSFIFSLLLIPFFINHFVDYNVVQLFIITLVISLISQLGDLFISLLKRIAKVKNTSDILPGHGGILDRIDGMIFSIPFSFIIFNYF